MKKKINIISILVLLLFLFANSSNGQSFQTFTDTRDGHIYRTVTIGTQTWLADNLAYLPKVDLVTVETVEEGPKTPRYYIAFFDDTAVNKAKETQYYKTYGVLYNWAAAKTACPAGWHLPTDEEWKTLERFLGMPEALLDERMYREDGKVGDQLKSKTEWKDFGSDNLGFGALPGGFRHGYDPNDPAGPSIIYVGKEAFFWTTTLYYKDGMAWRRQIVSGTHGVVRYPHLMEQGYSVRCIKDK